MKHGNSYYIQLSRLIFNEEPYKSLSINAKWLYVVLKELEQRYTGSDTNWFFRSNEELAEDMGVSLKTLKKAKAELVKTDLIKIGVMHWISGKGTPHEKRSEKHVTSYTILK